MTELIKLELRKNRLLLFGMMAVSFICGVSLRLAVVLWFLLLITGASCGAQFRLTMRTEEDFPQTPQKRIWAAFLAGLVIYFGICAAGIAGFFLHSPLHPAPDMQLLLIFTPSLLPFYACAFLIAFATGNGVLGGALALLQIITAISSISGFISWQDISDTYGDIEFIVATTAILTIVCVGLSWFASAISRNYASTTKRNIVLTAIIAWPLVLPSYVGIKYAREYSQKLSPVIQLNALATDEKSFKTFQFPDGILVRSAFNNIYYLHPDGSRKLLLKRSFFHLTEPFDDRYLWTANGDLWFFENYTDTLKPVPLYHADKNGKLVFFGNLKSGGYYNFLRQNPEGLFICKYTPSRPANQHWSCDSFPPDSETARTIDTEKHYLAKESFPHIPGAPAETRPAYGSDYGKLPGGGFISYLYKTGGHGKDLYTYYSMTEDGTVNRPFKGNSLHQIVRVEKDKVIFIDGGDHVYKINTDTGKKLYSFYLSIDYGKTYDLNIQISRAGVFAFRNGKVTFYDWDWNKKQL